MLLSNADDGDDAGTCGGDLIMVMTRKMVRTLRVLCGNQLTNLKAIMLRSVSSLCFWV